MLASVRNFIARIVLWLYAILMRIFGRGMAISQNRDAESLCSSSKLEDFVVMSSGALVIEGETLDCIEFYRDVASKDSSYSVVTDSSDGSSVVLKRGGCSFLVECITDGLVNFDDRGKYVAYDEVKGMYLVEDVRGMRVLVGRTYFSRT